MAVVGYPACAGIDLIVWCKYTHEIGLPRMRGDRPHTPRPFWQAPRATPHARGSTLLRVTMPGRNCGYPACAGIDLCLVLGAVYLLRLPRMRGDRPPLYVRNLEEVAATPHARGSTP